MVWIALAGTALEVVGLTLAVVGVSETYRESLDRDLWHDVRADLGRWFRRAILQKPQARPVYHGVARQTLPSLTFGQAFGQVRPPKPGDDASNDVKVDYLMRVVELVSQEVTAARAHADTMVRDAEARIAEQNRRVGDQLADADKQLRSLRTALVGIDGSGLRRAAVGLTVTLIGVVLSVAGLT